MTEVVPSGKSAATNPLKQSPALGGAMAFLGIEGSLPLFHGSQGCTAFALVLMVRHFREAIPLQTTAMNELTTILGGADNVEQAISNIRERANPRLIGICSTALTETRGEDMRGDLRTIRGRHPEWSGALDVVFATTPDYGGSLEEGWGEAVRATIEELVPEGNGTRTLRQVNILAGAHLSPADVEELAELVESFALTPVILPDLSNSLDGHVPDGHVSTSLGGTPLAAIGTMATSVLTLAIGEHMRPAAEALTCRCGVPHRVFDHLTGLAATDAFAAALIEAGGEPSARVKRDRSRLVDAMLDGHFWLDGRRVGIAAEADLLLALSDFMAGMGALVTTAVSPAPSPSLQRVPAPRVLIGDLDDLEQGSVGCDLLMSNSHAREAAGRLGIPLFRVGFPVFDRLGVPQRVSVGYRGTRQLIFEVANVVLASAAHGGASHGEGHHGESGHDEGGHGNAVHGHGETASMRGEDDRHAQAQAG